MLKYPEETYFGEKDFNESKYTYKIENGVKEIGKGAFVGTKLESVEIPPSVEKIEKMLLIQFILKKLSKLKMLILIKPL